MLVERLPSCVGSREGMCFWNYVQVDHCALLRSVARPFWFTHRYGVLSANIFYLWKDVGVAVRKRQNAVSVGFVEKKLEEQRTTFWISSVSSYMQRFWTRSCSSCWVACSHCSLISLPFLQTWSKTERFLILSTNETTTGLDVSSWVLIIFACSHSSWILSVFLPAGCIHYA